MPPKVKITKEMVIHASFEIIREFGESSLNARTIAQRLNCSTQPVLYCFKTMDDIRKEAYQAADQYHTQYIMQIGKNGNPPKDIWKNYIRFGYEEKNLFRFLFQSDAFSGKMQGLFAEESLTPLFMLISQQTGIALSDVKRIFPAVFYPIHGIASLLANNSIEYNEQEYDEVINLIIAGVFPKQEEKV